jgi:hypothetical protein
MPNINRSMTCLSTIAPTAFLLLLALSSLSVRSQEDGPPIDAQVYYSKDDPKWPEAEKAVDAAAKRFPRMRFEKISIDTDEGYQKLAAAEKQNLITKTGEITLVMGPLSLTDKGERRDIEKYLEPMIDRILHPEKAKGKLQADIAAYVKDVFGKDATTEALPAKEQDHTIYYRVKNDGKHAGWAVEAYRHIGCPVCNDAQFMVALDPEFKVIDLRPVRELEIMGRKLDEKETAAFTGQFKGKTADGKEVKVDGISGATKTTHAYEYALTDILKEIRAKVGGK